MTRSPEWRKRTDRFVLSVIFLDRNKPLVMLNVEINAMVKISWSKRNKLQTKTENFKSIRFVFYEKVERRNGPTSSGYSSSMKTPSVSSSWENRIFVRWRIAERIVKTILMSFEPTNKTNEFSNRIRSSRFYFFGETDAPHQIFLRLKHLSTMFEIRSTRKNFAATRIFENSSRKIFVCFGRCFILRRQKISHR